MREDKNTFSRRDFGKTVLVGTSALSTFGILKNANAAEPMKIGVVGCGGRGTGAVQNAMKANENIQLVAVADAWKERAEGLAKSIQENENLKDKVQVGENIFGGLDGYKKLMDLKLDYVILTTPPGFRPEHFEHAVDKGLNIFCEKPVATDAPGIRRFMAAAKKSEEKKLHIVTGNQRRHEKSYVETVKKLHDGAMGEIVTGRAYWDGTLPHCRERKEGQTDLEYQLYNWYNFCWICGDNIVEQHLHNLDVMNWIFKSHPISVVASGGRTWKTNEEKFGNIWDSFSCDYEYPNGVHVMSFCRHWNNSYEEVSEMVWGTNRDFHKGISRCNDMGERGEDPYMVEHRALQASITGKGQYKNMAMEIAESTMTCIMGRMAAYSGKKLSWDEALNDKEELVPKDMTWDMKLPVSPVPVPGKKA